MEVRETEVMRQVSIKCWRYIRYINPAIDRWARESTLAGKIPM